MSRIWLIAKHHFKQETSKKSFLLILFSMPLFLILMIGFGFLFAYLEEDKVTLGYVDDSGVVENDDIADSDEDIVLKSFANRESALSALESEEIDAFFVLPAGYRETHEAELVYYEQPRHAAIREFEDLVRLSLLSDQPAAVVERMLNGTDVTVRAIESKREYPSGAPAAGQILPLLIAAIFSFLVLTTSGYMVSAVVTEKESRTMEIVISSVSPGRLLAGKIVGAVGIAFLQLLVWISFLIAATLFGAYVLDIEWLRTIEPSWRDLLLVVFLTLPSYIFIAAIMTAIGATLSDGQDADQVGPLLFLILLLPVYLIVPIAANPNGPLALALTYFPATSVITLAIRSLFMEIPAWQFLTVTLFGFAWALVAMWLAGKAFRMSMLRYGQRLRLNELIRPPKFIKASNIDS